jgi:hypothetical protein
MTDPVERERRKYSAQKMARQWARGRRIWIWLQIGVVIALFAAALFWRK